METSAQRSARHCMAMLAPFEASDPKNREGQEQFYRLMYSIYEGMYTEPEAWFVFPAPYEEYIEKRKVHAAGQKKENEHSNDSRESTLRNTFQQAIQFYAMYFYNLGLQAERVDKPSGALLISAKAYADVLKKLGRLHESKYNAQRYGVLEKLGIRVQEDGGMVRVVHERKPYMMQGLMYLCKAPESKYKWMNFLRLDYKNAYSPIPAVADICRTLPAEYAAVVGRLEDEFAGRKVKVQIKPLRGIVSDFCWKVLYTYKGSGICGFYADNESFMLCLHFNHFSNITAFASALYEEDRELFTWFQAQFPERLCKCPNNRRVSFAGEARRICGLCSRAEIVNPTPEDVDRALTVLRRFRGNDGVF